jgi:hypothetical protein
MREHRPRPQLRRRPRPEWSIRRDGARHGADFNGVSARSGAPDETLMERIPAGLRIERVRKTVQRVATLPPKRGATEERG